MCPTVLNPRSLAPLDARLMVLTGDHGLGARRVQAVLPDLPEATAVVLNDYAGLTWADLAADRRDHIDAAIREFHQRSDACPAADLREQEGESPVSRFASVAPDRRWCCCRLTSRPASGNR